MRDIGLNILKKYCKEYKKLEQNIYNICLKRKEDYLNNIQEICERLENGEKIKTIILSKKFGWKNKIFKNIEEKMKEHEEYLLNPFSVSDGVIQCKRCKSYKTFSCQVQTRSSDESSTTIARCMVCNVSWAYSG